MKKQKLIIYGFSCLLLVFTQQATASSNTSFIKTVNKSPYGSVFPASSRSGIDIYACNYAISLYSQKSNGGYNSWLIATMNSFFNPVLKKDDTEKNGFSFKKHLLHIYPSHCFW